MIINKYNSAKGNNLTRIGISTGAISSGSSSSTGGGEDIDRELWGQKDEGGDIDGSMWVNGSLYLGEIDYSGDDTEEDETKVVVDNSNYVDDAEIGSVIAGGLVQAKDMYCKEHPYITYPITNGKKTDLRELFNGFDERINANTTNITANTTEITNLKSRVTNLENNGGGGTGTGDSMPVGSIIMFSGKAEEIPSGWAICDGTNGTPNLIDKFIKGSNIAGSTGGASQITLSVAQLPPHNHQLTKCYYGKADNVNDTIQVVRWYEDGLPQAQITTSATGSGSPIDITPPYYTLIYIMKIATT